MAVLQNIRKRSGLLVGIIAVGLLAFVIPWSEISQFINSSKNKAFTVDGNVIKIEEYSARIKQWEEFQKIMTNSPTLSEEELAGVRDNAYQQMVKEIALNEECSKLGLTVTKEEMVGMTKLEDLSPILYQIPFFADPSTGSFSYEALQGFLTALSQPKSSVPVEQQPEIEHYKQLWLFIENIMKYYRLEEKYTALTAGLIPVNNLDVKAAVEGSRKSVNLSYISLPYSDIEDSAVEVSTEELKKLYTQRKNNFKQDYPTRTLAYFVKDVLPSEEDYTQVKVQVEEAAEKLRSGEDARIVVSQYSEDQFVDVFFSIDAFPYEVKSFVESSNVGTVSVPSEIDRQYVVYKYLDRIVASDSVEIQILPIQAHELSQVDHLADSLLNVVKKGKDIQLLGAELFPGQPGIGMPQWVTEAALAGTGVERECFGASVGEVKKLTLQGQTVLLRVARKTKPITKAKVAVVRKTVLASDKTINAADNEINRFLAESGEASKFADAAKSAGYDLIEDYVMTPADHGIAEVPSSRSVVSWAFNDDKKEVKKFEIATKRVVALVTDKSEPGYQSYENKNINEFLRTEIMQDKKAELLIKDLTDKKASSLEAYAEAVETEVTALDYINFQSNSLASLGFEPVINAYASVAEEGVISEPIKGYNGVYVLKVNSKEDNSTTIEDEDQIRMSLDQTNKYMLGRQAIAVLVEKMNVKDNRIAFF